MSARDRNLAFRRAIAERELSRTIERAARHSRAAGDYRRADVRDIRRLTGLGELQAFALIDQEIKLIEAEEAA